jgi:hypothetical protein
LTTIIAVWSWGFGGQSVVSPTSSEFDQSGDFIKWEIRSSNKTPTLAAQY